MHNILANMNKIRDVTIILMFIIIFLHFNTLHNQMENISAFYTFIFTF